MGQSSSAERNNGERESKKQAEDASSFIPVELDEEKKEVAEPPSSPGGTEVTFAANANDHDHDHDYEAPPEQPELTDEQPQTPQTPLMEASQEEPSVKIDQVGLTLRKWAEKIKEYEDFEEVSMEQLQRCRVVYDRFNEDCSLSFNYIVLLLCASGIAGFGLVNNSSATIIASMLVSPIMGPVSGMGYGTTICNWRMVKRSVFNEIGSLIVCIGIGALIGAATGKTELADEWPNDEMKSRGELSNLYVGLFVAVLSGIAGAVTMLDDKVSSLVGVAISASLLPPAVNAGLLWVAYGYAGDSSMTSAGEDSYSKQEFKEMGLVSLSLTLTNIILVYLSMVITFRIKEVIPIKKKVFWSDLRIARKIYRRRAVYTQEGHQAVAAGDNEAWKEDLEYQTTFARLRKAPLDEHPSESRKNLEKTLFAQAQDFA